MRKQARRQALLAIVSGCVVLVFGLGASVNLAVGRLAISALRPTPAQVLWIVDTYLVAFGCLLIPAGALGDRYGHKRMLSAGLLILAAGSIASALAPTVLLLLAGRALAGAGAALILPNSLSLLVDAFPPEARPQAIAVWTGMTGLGGALGNVGGGLVLQYYDWQMLFAIAAPLAVIAWLMVACAAPNRAGGQTPLDMLGVGILVPGVFALLYGIIEGPEHGWTSETVLGSFAAAAVIFTWFVRHGLRREHPLIDPRLLRLPGLGAGSCGVVLSFVGMYSVFYLNGQYMMSAKGYSPLIAGLCVMPMAVALFVVSPRSVTLARRHGPRKTLMAGLFSLAAGLALLACCTRSTPYPVYGAILLLIGLGSALSNPLLSMAIIASLPPGQAGIGTGINSFTREIGGALGVALFGSLLNAAYAQRLPPPVRLLVGPADGPAGRAIGSTLAAIHQHAGAQAARLEALAQDAFTDAMGLALLVVVALLLLGSIPVALWIREGITAPESPAAAKGDRSSWPRPSAPG
jgi:EmrB/QacA subfamily drug resistance transporter